MVMEGWLMAGLMYAVIGVLASSVEEIGLWALFVVFFWPVYVLVALYERYLWRSYE